MSVDRAADAEAEGADSEDVGEDMADEVEGDIKAGIKSSIEIMSDRPFGDHSISSRTKKDM